MKQIKQLMSSDIGRIVFLEEEERTHDEKKVYTAYRIKSYDNAHGRVWIVPNTPDWKRSIINAAVGYKSVFFQESK